MGPDVNNYPFLNSSYSLLSKQLRYIYQINCDSWTWNSAVNDVMHIMQTTICPYKRWILRISNQENIDLHKKMMKTFFVWPLGCIFSDLWVHKWFTLSVSKADGPYDSCRFYCRAPCVITIDHTIHVTTHLYFCTNTKWTNRMKGAGYNNVWHNKNCNHSWKYYFCWFNTAT